MVRKRVWLSGLEATRSLVGHGLKREQPLQELEEAYADLTVKLVEK